MRTPPYRYIYVSLASLAASPTERMQNQSNSVPRPRALDKFVPADSKSEINFLLFINRFQLLFSQANGELHLLNIDADLKFTDSLLHRFTIEANVVAMFYIEKLDLLVCSLLTAEICTFTGLRNEKLIPDQA